MAKLVLGTAPEGEAGEIAEELVEEKLAACVNVLEANSIYRWDDEVVEDEESILMMKTREGRIRELEKSFEQSCSYDVPEFLVLDVEGGSEAYLEWLAEATGGA